jgi:hypothetical protein
MTAFVTQYKSIKQPHRSPPQQQQRPAADPKADPHQNSKKVLAEFKRLLLTLNDIRILLTNVYTKEYVLESLRADKLITVKNSLGAD